MSRDRRARPTFTLFVRPAALLVAFVATAALLTGCGPPTRTVTMPVDVEPQQGPVPLTVSFEANPEIDGEPLRESDDNVESIEITWMHDDEEFGTGRQAEHEFTEPGKQLVIANLRIVRSQPDSEGNETFEADKEIEILAEEAE